MPRYDLAGRTIAITGGTGGFARALAPALRERGANIALLDLDLDLDLDTDAAEAAAAGLGPATVARGWRADVRDLGQLKKVMAEVAEHFGRLDIVIANAGLGDVAVLLAEDDPAHWDRMVDINLSGVYRTFRAAFPYVSDAKGYMLATSSMAAFVHSPLQGAYTATKAGVWALCDTWRLEVRHTGVAVGSLHPTFFKTPMMDDIHANPAGRRLWNGNTSGLWKMVDTEVVVADTVAGIQRRAKRIVSPGKLRFAALSPGLAQAVVDRIGFPGKTIQEATDLIFPREGSG